MAFRYAITILVWIIAIVLVFCYNSYNEEAVTMDYLNTFLTIAISVIVIEAVNLIVYFVKRNVEGKDAFDKQL